MRHSFARRAAFLVASAVFSIAVTSALLACTQRGGAATLGPQATTARAQVAPGGGSPTAQSVQVPGGNPELGKRAIEKYGCGACHVIPGVPGANGTIGPSLAGFGKSPDIAKAAPNTPAKLVEWIRDPRWVKPGTAMPNLGVSEPEARNTAAYLYTLN